MRRVVDVVFAFLWLVITTPLIILIAFLIKFESEGPIFYAPTMVGFKGQPFTLFRFHTMSTNTPNHGLHRTLTRIGAFIRNYSLDHLPMLIHLLKGYLSIISPRPMEMHAVELADPVWQRYFQVKPGLFNYAVLKLGKFWLANRMNRPDINQTLELEYRQKQSPIFDLQLVIQFLQAYVVSRDNIKARGIPAGKIESRLKNDTGNQPGS